MKGIFPNAEQRFHDPLIYKEGDVFYALSTDYKVPGVNLYTSKDLLQWENLGPLISEIPQEIQVHSNLRGFWAPELVKRNGEYRLYTSASSFGSQQSVISLFTSNRIDGKYQYKMDIVKTYEDAGLMLPNAIDANVISNRNGEDFLIYGSFFGGIYILALDSDGLPAEKTYGKRIAGGNHTAVEGAYVYYDRDEDLYFLFLSYGSLTYDYNIRIATSKEITGPYEDSLGHEMTNLDPVLRVGDKIIGGYNFDLEDVQGLMAPGHNSLLKIEKELYLVHHMRIEHNVNSPFLNIRKLYKYGHKQFLVSPFLYSGLTEELSSINHFLGEISIIRFDRFNQGVTYARKIQAADLSFTVNAQGVELSLFNSVYRGICIRQGNRHAFMGVNSSGEHLWAVNSEKNEE